MPPADSRRSKFLLVLLSFTITLTLIEILLRVSGALNIPSREIVGNPYIRPSAIEGVRFDYKPNYTWSHRYSDNPRGYFDGNNSITYTTNEQGYRDRNFVIEKQNSFRIAFLGDSFGFGTGVRLADRHTEIMEPILQQQTGCNIEIYNFSVQGYSTVEEASLLSNYVIRYEPDMVIVWYFLNDPEVAGTMSFFQPEPSFQVKYLAIARIIEQALKTANSERKLVETYRTSYQSELWDNAADSIRSMAKVANNNHIPIVLFVHPILYNIGNYPFEDIHQQVIRLADEHGYITEDLLPAFEGYDGRELWVHGSDPHPNEIAHKLSGEYAAKKLIEHIACKEQ